MIDIDSMKEENKGDEVVYVDKGVREFGVVSSWNQTYIFVKFYQRMQSQACKPEMLTFTMRPKEQCR
ncbi:hypothetical protein AGMMS49944_04050 [Spirochaetia bacterium]|nr:hypothetical protein AGMMS49944_04050 [Spirochaetia bacterium]